jgi:hypothetical protein
MREECEESAAPVGRILAALMTHINVSGHHRINSPHVSVRGSKQLKGFIVVVHTNMSEHMANLVRALAGWTLRLDISIGSVALNFREGSFKNPHDLLCSLVAKSELV